MLRKNRFDHLDLYPKNNSFMEYNYQTNDTDIIGKLTKELGEDFVAELVSDRSFLSQKNECRI